MFPFNDIEFNFDDSEFSCSNQENLDHESIIVAADNMFRKPTSSLSLEKMKRNNTGDITNILKPSLIEARTPIITKVNDSSNKIAVKRKFPGPAGLLPDKPPQFFNAQVAELQETEEHSISEADNILCSQTSDLIFLEPPFKKLREDFNIENVHSPLSSFTVEWVKKKTCSKSLKGQRIPFLALILLSVDCSSADPVLTLRDPTGELFGVLHRDVWKEMGDQLRPGAALVLKEVGVLSTGVTRRHVMVNITKNNLLTVYAPCAETGVIVNSVQPTSNEDILNCIKEWQIKAAQVTSPAPSRSSPLSVPSLFQNFNMNPSTPKTPVNQCRNLPSRPKLTSNALNLSQSSNFDLSFDNIDFPNLDNNKINTNNLVKNNSPRFKPVRIEETNSIILSQAETSRLDEVLSGVDLDDFDGM